MPVEAIQHWDDVEHDERHEHAAHHDDGQRALNLAADAWSIGRMAIGPNSIKELPEQEVIRKFRAEQLAGFSVEAAVLERDSRSAIRYRSISEEELRSNLEK